MMIMILMHKQMDRIDLQDLLDLHQKSTEYGLPLSELYRKLILKNQKNMHYIFSLYVQRLFG